MRLVHFRAMDFLETEPGGKIPKMHDTVGPAGHRHTESVDGYRVDRDVACRDLVDVLSPIDVPPDDAFGRSGEDRTLYGMLTHRPNAFRVSVQHVRTLSLPNVPHTQRTVVTSAHDLFRVVAREDARDGVLMTSELSDAFRCSRVVDSEELVASSRH